MEIIKFDRVVSVNSEIQGHSAQNILEGEIRPNKNWMCEKGTDKAIAILQLERAVVLSSIHIGNAHSAFVEILVGKAADSSDSYESLIPMSTFMNPQESKTGTNPNRTRFFAKGDFNEATAGKSWDRIKVVCSQPFNKHIPYGLCFIKVHGEKEGKKMEVPVLHQKVEDEDEIQIGSFFKKKKNSDADKPLSVTEQIKEAEKETSLAKHTPISVSKLAAKMSEKISSDKKSKRKREKDKIEEPTEKRKKEGEKTPKKKKEEKTPKKTKVEETVRKRKVDEILKTDKEKEEKKKKKKKPFEKLLEDVVLVISGFQNPLRGNIRSQALEMGAKYSADWDSHCTHLVCAYDNTPKYNQVKGKGKIIKKEWIEKCHADRRRYPWRKFALDKSELKKPESEEEIEAGEDSESEDEDTAGPSGLEKKKKADDGVGEKKKKSAETDSTDSDTDEYNVSTDEDENETAKVDTSDYPMPFLPDMFSLKTFYLDPQLKNKSVLERYIVAYNGILLDKFSEDVEIYITERGGTLLETFRKKAPKVVAVKPSWLWEVNAKQNFIPVASYLVK